MIENAGLATWSSSLHEPRAIKWDGTGIKPCTFNSVLLAAVQRYPNRVQYVTAADRQVTVSEFYALSRAVAKSLLHCGLELRQGVAIMGFNAVEWFAADVAGTLAGGVSAGIYTTNKAEIVKYILNHSCSRAVFVDDETGLKKVMDVWGECPHLVAVVVWGGDVDLKGYEQHGKGLHSWEEFLQLGTAVDDAVLDGRIDDAKPEHVAKLIYTSGTTGPPKAVMISHDNVTFTVDIIGRFMNITHEDELLSFLPPSHIASNAIDICGALTFGVKITIARPDALKGSLVQSLKKTRPTIFLAVPRVFEKIQEKMQAIGVKNGFLKKLIATWAKGIGTRATDARRSGEEMMPWGYELAKALVFENVRKALGLDRCRVVFNAAAPLQPATIAYFNSLNLEIFDVYGMTEATGPLTCNFPDFKAGTSGKAVGAIEVKVLNPDSTQEGELLFRGRNLFVGYLNNAEESRKTLDEDGFMHTGDLGRVDEEGFVRITGRVKELIVTAGGENIAPALVEKTLISAMAGISRAFAIGDQRKFLSCLLVPCMDEAGRLIGPATQVNADITRVEETIGDEKWDEYIKVGIEKANEDAISNAAKVRKYCVLTKDFSVDGGELTPTMKVKRKVVLEKYQDVAENMYEM